MIYLPSQIQVLHNNILVSSGLKTNVSKRGMRFNVCIYIGFIYLFSPEWHYSCIFQAVPSVFTALSLLALQYRSPVLLVELIDVILLGQLPQFDHIPRCGGPVDLPQVLVPQLIARREHAAVVGSPGRRLLLLGEAEDLLHGARRHKFALATVTTCRSAGVGEPRPPALPSLSISSAKAD